MIVSVIAFFLVLSVLVLFHEAGHFFAARKNGIWVEEFGFGLPPRVIGKKIKDTIYSLNWLPFGGFVRLHGENLEETITNPSLAFLNKSKKVRTVVIVAGVVMNILLAVVCFSIVYTITGIPRHLGYVQVTSTISSAPASEAGIQVNDIIKTVDGVAIDSNDQFKAIVDQKRGQEIALKLQRDDKELIKKIIPRQNPPENEGALGVGIMDAEIYYPPLFLRPIYGAYYGFGDALFWGKTVVVGLVTMINDAVHGHIPKDVSGPVGIYTVTKEIVSLGVLPVVNFVGVLSVNLAIVNILPFPALDGGRLLFIIIEALTKKRVTPKTESTIHAVGMIVLLAMVGVVTIFDLKRLAGLGQLPSFLTSIFK